MQRDPFDPHQEWTPMDPFPVNVGISESYIPRTHLEVDYRARRAVYLLRERDRRIEFLEQRVNELENAAATLHALTLRVSSRSSQLNVPKTENVIGTVNSGKSTSLYGTSPCRSSTYTSVDPSEKELACEVVSKSVRKTNEKEGTGDVSHSPEYTTPTSDEPPIDNPMENERCQINETKSKEEQVTVQRDDIQEETVHKEETKINESTENARPNTSKEHDKGVKQLKKSFSSESLSRLTNRSSNLRKLCNKNFSQVSGSRDKRNSRTILREKYRKSSFTLKVSCSMPWVRGHRSNHRETSGMRTRVIRHSNGVSCSSSTSAGANELDDSDGVPIQTPLDVKEAVVPEPVEDLGSPKKAQEEGPIAETKSISTQTLTLESDIVPIQDLLQNSLETFRTESLSEDKRSLSFWSINDEPPSAEVCKDLPCLKEDDELSNKFHYENIILDLETKLERARADHETAMKAMEFSEENSKKELEKAKKEARRENDILQEKIVKICSSVLEKFGPYALQARKEPTRPRSSRLLKYYQMSSKKLRRRLRTMRIFLRKIKNDLKVARESAKEKSEKYDTLKKYFNRLKEETEITSANLNKIITENTMLREKTENMKEWLELQVPKDKAQKYFKVQCRLAQKRSEILSLRQRSDEDTATIIELRNKLLQMESADANKEFVLNSYKGQLTELYKERHQFLAKISVLENEIRIIRSIHYEGNEW